jgi:E3 ubiquitin-protein ligase HERC2
LTNIFIVRNVIACCQTIFRWDELEEMICGKPDIDVKLLENITEYSSCSSSDAHIRMFWTAMDEFNNEERSAFIKFTWGRSRLPLNAAGFTQRFKLQSFDKSPADNYLPVAHTCFFSLELPRYTTLEIMKEKLRYAIFNCQAIDGDETSMGMTVAAMGWEEEDDD